MSGRRVETVLSQEGRVQGVQLADGSVVAASAVILATSPADAVKLVDRGTYDLLRAIIASLLPARLACLDVDLRRLPVLGSPVVQDLDQPRFLSAQSVYSQVAPAGEALIYTFKMLDPNNPGDARQHGRDLEDLLDAVQPGWREVLVKRLFLPHIEAIGMPPTATGRGYAGRPGPAVPGRADLYLAGDWIGPGFLSDASLGSARQIAQLILADGKHVGPAVTAARKATKEG